MKKPLKRILTFIMALTMALNACLLLTVGTGAAESDSYKLVTHWDFEGEGSDIYADKAKFGVADTLTPNGTVTVKDGVAEILDGANYITASSAEGTDLYNMKDKTFLIKAKLDKFGGTVAGFFSKENVFSYGIQGPSTDENNKAAALYVNGTNLKGTGNTPIDVGEYRMYAITFDYDEETGKTVINLYMSTKEFPTSAEDFSLLVTVTEKMNVENAGELLIGKRNAGHKESNRNLNTYIDDVKLFDGVLTTEQLVANSPLSYKPTFQCVQTAQGIGVNTKDDTFAIRFVGTTGSINVKALGYKVVATDGNNTLLRAEELKNVNNVYTSILANEKYGLTEFEAYKDFHSTYIFTLSVINIPLEMLDSGKSIVFIVTPYSVATDSTNEDFGDAYKCTVTKDLSGKLEVDIVKA